MKPEARYVRSVNQYLVNIHHQSMAFTFTNGTPDQYYDGSTRDLWVEYKWIKKTTGILVPKLTELQRRWLIRRWDTGKNAWVIIGTPIGGTILRTPESWETGIAPFPWLRPSQVAYYIRKYCDALE